MGVRIFKVVPPPQPEPPTRFNIEGLSKAELSYLYSAISTRLQEIPINLNEERTFLERLHRLTSIEPSAHPTKVKE
jgi:hypothetical protein